MRLKAVLALCLAGVMMQAAQSASAETARERLHESYRLLVEAQTLVVAGDRAAAIEKYRGVVSDLESLRRDYPGWQREIVNARLAHARNRLAKLAGEADAVVVSGGADADGKRDDYDVINAVDLELQWREKLAARDQQVRVLRRENSVLKSRLRALELMPESDDGIQLPEQVSSSISRMLVSESETLQTDDRMEVAIKLLEAARKLLPVDEDIRLALGVAYCREGDFQKASRLLRDVAASNPANLTARLALGAAWMGLGYLGAARAEIEAVLQIDPDNADAHYNMARLLVMLPNPDPAGARWHYRRSVYLGGATDAQIEHIIQRATLQQIGRER